MKFSLKRFILGGIIAASITGIIISCETVDPATMKTVSSIDYSPIRLIDANKGAPGQTVVINVPNTNVNGNQGEVDVTNVDNGEENNNPAAGEQNGGTEDNQTGTNPEGVGSENENTGTDNTDSTTTEPSGNKTESGNAGDNENVSGDKTGKSDSPVSGPNKNTASGGSNNTGSTQTAAESARERVLRQARENIDNGKYSQAITALNTWLKSNPDDGDAKNLLEEAKEKQAQANAEAAEKARQDKLKQARDYIDAGKYSNAITVLNGLLKTDPNDAEAKALLEEAKEKQEKANAEAAAKARSDKLKQARDYIDAGKYSNAITVLNGLLKTDPNDAEAKALLEEAKEKQEKANAEAAAKARADKLKQAKDYIDAGKYSNAITVLNGLLKSDPNDAEAKKLLEEAQSKQAQANADAAAKARADKLKQAKDYIDAGKYSNAITVLNGLLKTDPNDAEAKALLEEAKEKQEKANAEAAAKARADKLKQAKDYIDAGKYSNAISVLNGLLKTDPNDAEAKSLLEEAKEKQEKANAEAAAKARADKLKQVKDYIDAGKYSNAITVLNGLLKTDPNDAEAKALLDEAKEKQEKANAEAAAKARADKLKQAKDYIDAGKYSNAITVLNGLLKTDPNDAEAKKLLDEAKEKQSAEEKAKKEAADKAAAEKKAQAEAAAEKKAAEEKAKKEAAEKAAAEKKAAEEKAKQEAEAKAAAEKKAAEEKAKKEAAEKAAAEKKAADEKAKQEAANKARQDKLKQARDYIDSGKYSNAITVLNGLLKTDPNDAEAKALLEEAKEKQEKANAEAAAKARADKLKQAKDYIDAGKYSNAITMLNGLLKTDPNDAEAKALLDEAKEKQEKANADAAAKARADKLKQAKDYIDAGKYTNAISVLNGLLKTDPNDAEAKALLDEAKEKQEKANAEAAAKARADKLKQAKDYIDGGKYTQAISLLNGLLKTDPNDAEAKALLEEAKAKQEKANADAAAKARQDKLKQAKDYIDGGKYAQAISVLNGLLKSDPNDAEAKKLLEEAQAKQAEEQKAKQEAAAKKAAEDKAKKEAADKAAAEKKAAEEKAKKEAAEKAAAEKKAAEEKAKQEAAEKAAAEKKAAEEKAKQEAEAKAAAEKKAAEEKAKQEAAEKAAAEKKAAEEEKARKEAEAKANQEALVELQKFTTDWESPQLSDIEDCGYFYTSPEFGQFDMIEGEFSKKSGYIKSAYGFVFGYTRPSSTGKLYNYIRFEINTDGEYALYKWDGKTYTDLVEPNDEGTAYFYPSTAINKGYNAINKLKIQVNDGKYDVYINGRLIKKGIEFIPNGTYGVMGFFSVGQVTQEDLPYTPVVVSYRITDAVLHNPKNGK